MLSYPLSFAHKQSVCTTFASCCDLCGADSIRCARGPASQTFWSKSFFNFSLPIDKVGFWDVVFSFYGMVPYLAVIFAVGHLLVTWAIRRDRRILKWGIRILVLCFAIITTVIRAVIIKSLGDCTQCYRPCGSAAGVYGLPSGHSMASIGLCAWLLLEVWCGTRTTHWLKSKQILTSVLLVLVFVPVPYSRVYLGDHTHLQVEVGSALGLVLGVAYFLLLGRFVLYSKPQDASVCLNNDDEDAVQVTVITEATSKDDAEATNHQLYQQLSPLAPSPLPTA